LNLQTALDLKPIRPGGLVIRGCAAHFFNYRFSTCELFSVAGGTHDLVDPVAAAADRVEGEVGGALVDGAGDASAGVAEAVDKFLA